MRQLRQFDPRHLFAQASNYDFGDPEFAVGDDYWTTFRTRKGAEGAVRGSYAHVDAPLGHIQTGPPGTAYDYTKAIAGVPAPVIGHEVGQYQTYPDFKEIEKYTGVLRAWNFEVFRRRLAARGMLDQADDFVAPPARCRRSVTARKSRPRCERPASADSNCSICRITPAKARRSWGFSTRSWIPRD